MANKVKIQVQDQFGKWQNYTTVSGYPSSIKQGMEAALKTAMGRNSGKARAIDAETGVMIDMLFK
ncbi:hypothetical protein [Arenimonas sp.]|jgi:hypothetical protein|uniref:hypothetical protein n=1 Tax=Arenimonas sp. TaxID=1872635 RepID=UPI0037BE2225